MEREDAGGIHFRVIPTSQLDGREAGRVIALFSATYRAANVAYLEKSLGRFRFLSTAESAGDFVGFALGEMRVMDLPRLPGQTVALAGICCVDARFRRRGLFRQLEGRAFAAARITMGSRALHCGRMAHPASFRTMTANPSHVPKRGVAPTPWQQEVGAAIAADFGVPGFDPATFRCAGAGVPIGYPVLEIDVRPEEWDVFAPVDRDRGDSLLGLCWIPDAPAGW